MGCSPFVRASFLPLLPFSFLMIDRALRAYRLLKRARLISFKRLTVRQRLSSGGSVDLPALSAQFTVTGVGSGGFAGWILYRRVGQFVRSWRLNAALMGSVEHKHGRNQDTEEISRMRIGVSVSPHPSSTNFTGPQSLSLGLIVGSLN
jgi:hypothetical protein